MARISDVFAFNVESHNVSRKIYSFNSRITVRGQAFDWIIFGRYFAELHDNEKCQEEILCGLLRKLDRNEKKFRLESTHKS